MQRPITRGASAGPGLIFHVFAQDSAATDGEGKASIAFGSWACRYIRNGEASSGAITPEDITTIGTYAAPTANTNIRIKAVDNTNMIGLYEIQIHADWVNATNSCQSLTIYLRATGAAVLPLTIPLVALNPQLAVPTATENAAAALTLDWTTLGSVPARCLLNAARFLRNKWGVVAGTLTVTEEDDTTTAWTAPVTTDAAAEPITGIDPA